MVSIEKDYSDLLKELIWFSNNFKFKLGEIVGLDGKKFEDESDETKVAFYLLYAEAYKYNYVICSMKDEDIFDGDFYQALIACSYDEFNYMINGLLKEYQEYGDIGTGNIEYNQYQRMADYMTGKVSNKEYAKATTITYLKTVFDLEDSKRGVK